MKKRIIYIFKDIFIMENRNKILLKFLVKHGMDVNKIVYKNGEIPLINACRSGNKDKIEYLLVEPGAYTNKVNKWSNKTPLLKAIKCRNKELVKYLLENGTNINKENKECETPLFKTIKRANKDLDEYLVEHGTDIKQDMKHHYSMNTIVEKKI